MSSAPFDTPPFDTTPQLPVGSAIPSSGGVTVEGYDLGGAGEDLLMVHATGFCAGVWLPMAQSLLDERIAMLDVRGHGRSSIPAGGMSWDGTADDVLAAIDALGLERPFGVGHSMGGASLLLAEQARPGTFRGLWIFEPIVFPPAMRDVERSSDGDSPLAAGARRRRATFASAEEAYANYASKPPLNVFDPAALAAYVRDGFLQQADGSVTLRCRPDIEAETYQMGPRHHGFEHLGEVACPVTVVVGATTPGPALFAPAIADALANGVLEEHPELGHFGPLEQPTAMAASVQAAVTAAS